MRIFITASDTDAGKTYVAAGLTRALMRRHIRVRTLKPVCCGRAPGTMNADVRALLEAQGWPPDRAHRICRHDFPDFAAPAQAAARAGEAIQPEELVRWCNKAAGDAELALIEGVGGLMVPLAPRWLVADWLAAMPDCRVLLVARACLGGINHALLTLKALDAMSRPPDWVVINDADAAGQDMPESMARALHSFLPAGTRLLALSHQPETGYAANDTVEELAADIARRCRCAC